MGRMPFTQELKALAYRAGEGIDAGDCWREVIYLHRELGKQENALGRAAWMMRYGQRKERREGLRDAAETLTSANALQAVLISITFGSSGVGSAVGLERGGSRGYGSPLDSPGQLL